MILDDKLIRLGDTIIRTCRTDLLMFQYQVNRVVISALNRNHTVILKIIVKRENLTDYPEVPSIYFLPVNGHNSWDDGKDVSLNLNEYKEFDSENIGDVTYHDLVTNLNCKIFVENGYKCYPFKGIASMVKISYYFMDNPSIDFKYNDYGNTISSNYLKEAFVGDIKDSLLLKLCHTDSPLFLQYDTMFGDLPAKVYGAIASRLETVSDLMIRIR